MALLPRRPSCSRRSLTISSTPATVLLAGLLWRPQPSISVQSPLSWVEKGMYRVCVLVCFPANLFFRRVARRSSTTRVISQQWPADWFGASFSTVVKPALLQTMPLLLAMSRYPPPFFFITARSASITGVIGQAGRANQGRGKRVLR